MQNQKVVLITGAAKRVGAVVARSLHDQGMRIAIHYSTSASDAQKLQDEFNRKRADSAIILQANLLDTAALPQLVEQTVSAFGQLDVLINNASTFYATPVGTITEDHWHDLMGTNLKGPLFLSQAAAPYLAKQKGCIINMADIHASQPLKSFPVYCIAKAGILMLTKVMAKELSPQVRVNAIAPGPILWPENQEGMTDALRDKIVQRTLLKRHGTPEDVAKAVNFFIEGADYVTGQVLAIDGGRSLNF